MNLTLDFSMISASAPFQTVLWPFCLSQYKQVLDSVPGLVRGESLGSDAVMSSHSAKRVLTQA